MTTDELRAKFRAWWDSDEDTPTFNCRPDSPLRWAMAGWYAAHSSRDAEVEALRDLILDREASIEMREHEVEALKKQIDDAPVYYIPPKKPNSEEGWLQVIRSVKALNDMRGKHVRLVIDTAMREDSK